MFKSRGRHARRYRRPVLPLWAGALVLAFQAMHEMDAATAAQNAQGGAL